MRKGAASHQGNIVLVINLSFHSGIFVLPSSEAKHKFLIIRSTIRYSPCAVLISPDVVGVDPLSDNNFQLIASNDSIYYLDSNLGDGSLGNNFKPIASFACLHSNTRQ